jgi:hypothetical protein
VSKPLKVRKRIFYEGSLEYKYNLNKELWEEMFVEPDVNGKFNVFMDFFAICYVFSFKTC